MSYFEDYDDMLSSPSKAEQIIEDAKAALWNELTDEVKQLMDDANEAKTKKVDRIFKTEEEAKAAIAERYGEDGNGKS